MISGAAIAAVIALAASAPGGPDGADWERRVVRCGGIAAPTLREESENVAVTRVRTERAARREALRSCVEALGRIQIAAGEVAGASLGRDAALRGAVEAVVERAIAASEPRFFSDGGVAVEASLALDGMISELLIGASLRPGGQGAAPRAPLPSDGAQPSGVIVDARGLDVSPALLPRVLDERGSALAGPATLARRAWPMGGAAYAGDVDAALSSGASRIGTSPRIVRARAARGCDVIVGDADADGLRDLPAIAEGRVVIVIAGPR